MTSPIASQTISRNQLSDRQREHQQQAGDDAEDRDERDERARNGRWASGLRVAHDQHRRADDDEGEQRADVRQLGQDASSGQERRPRWRRRCR